LLSEEVQPLLHLSILYSKIDTVQQQDRYKNILVIVIGFSLVAWILLQLGKIELRTAVVTWKIIITIGFLTLLIPPFARALEWAWLKLALALGWINSRILLTVIYFVFLMPIAWIARLFTNDPLMLKKKDTSTLYVTRDHKYTKEDLENIW
jgi:hypothetical protein